MSRDSGCIGYIREATAPRALSHLKLAASPHTTALVFSTPAGTSPKRGDGQVRGRGAQEGGQLGAATADVAPGAGCPDPRRKP